MTARTYFVANRVWWAVSLGIAPIVAAIFGDPVAGVVAAVVLVFPVFILFDTDRSWWSSEVNALLQDKDKSRVELRLLTISAAIGLVLGLVISFVLS